MTDSDVISLQCPPGLRWVKDAEQIIIVDEQRNAPIILQRVEAVIWDWLTLEHPYPKLLKLIAGLLKAPTEEAAAEQFGDMVQRWQASGLLETREGHDG